MNSIEKGHALEKAVHAIEQAILESSPMYSEHAFRIESRKIVRVDDVGHEIDLYVTVDPGGDYASTFIFECKNWAARVGKNEIIIFSEKIAATRAQQGFFIAREFTRDAIAQAAKDPRITLRTANDVSDSLIDLTKRFHFTLIDGHKISARITMTSEKGRVVVPDLEKSRIQTPLGDFAVREYITSAGTQLSKHGLRGFPSQDLAPGEYVVNAEGSVDSPEQCRIDGVVVQAIELEVASRVRVARPAVISQYEVDSRGRVLWLDTIEFGPYSFDTKLVLVPIDAEQERVSIQLIPKRQ
jgi:hypothetical protein